MHSIFLWGRSNMKRMKLWLLCWLALTLAPNQGEVGGQNHGPDKGQNGCHLESKECTQEKKYEPGKQDVKCCMEYGHSFLTNGDFHDSVRAIENLELYLEAWEVTETETLNVDRFMTSLYKPSGSFEGLDLYAADNEVSTNTTVANRKVSVELPRELDPGSNNTIIFCMFTWPEIKETIRKASGELYDNRLVGLSVRGKNISGLQECVNITMNFTVDANNTYIPRCAFLNFTTKSFSSDGCKTLLNPGSVTCSCNHLTYFGVLLVSTPLSSTDEKILTYITLIGCSLSLLALVITVLIFIMNRKIRADVSIKVHINLAIALILLNLHFLLSQAVAAQSSTEFCFYMAFALHYSLLATFIWVALEGFHIYLLLVRVFNIYVRRYLLKLSLVGWGVPAVIVSLVLIIKRDAYGHVSLGLSNSNSSQICYIVNNTVKMVTTVGVFILVFIFNVIMLGVAAQHILSLHKKKQFGEGNCDRAKRDTCTLLGLIILLGITWGLIFFSFGSLTIPGLYLFCIFNSLQGFFIFLWFVMSLRKIGKEAPKTSSDTRSTSD